MPDSFSMEKFFDGFQSDMAEDIDIAIDNANIDHSNIVELRVMDKNFRIPMEQAIVLRESFKNKEWKLVKESNA